jgi:hypothetical protein
MKITNGFWIYATGIAGGLSFFSSSLVIFIICRSEARLSTIYHRLLFLMCCTDILGSLAISITTVPMPKDLPQEMLDGGLEGSVRFGDDDLKACDTQRYFLLIGLSSMFSYNAMLCIYYACIITFRMNEKNVVKYVEPLLHIVPIIVAPLFVWLNITTKRNNHDRQTRSEQIAGSCPMAGVFLVDKSQPTAYLTFFLVAAILISLISVVWSVRRTERVLFGSNLIRHSSLSNGRILDTARRSHHNTKVILIQAGAYILTFTLTLFIFPFITRLPSVGHWARNIMLVVTPLQGFFNLIIFISHKIYNYRRTNTDASVCSVLYLLFIGHASESVLFSRISRIEYDADGALFHLEVTDELIITASSSDQEELFPVVTADDDCQDLSGFSWQNEEEKSQPSTIIKNEEEELGVCSQTSLSGGISSQT